MIRHLASLSILAAFACPLFAQSDALSRKGDGSELAAATAPAFVENHGAFGADARYVFRRPGLIARIEDDAVTLQLLAERGKALRGHVLRLEMKNASGRTSLQASDRLAGKEHWILGEDPGAARGAARYARLRSKDLYPGVDLVWRSNRGQLEYDFEVAAGADLATVEIHCAGAEGISINDKGGLELRTSCGTLTQPAPTTWEVDEHGKRVPLACRYRVLGENRYGFVVPRRTVTRRLVVDPVLTWSSFYGGAVYDYVRSVAVDTAGNVYAAGYTNSRNIPTTPGAFKRTGAGTSDGFLAKISANGQSLVYATYVGGELNDEVFDCAVDSRGVVTVVGHTGSRLFPTTSGSYAPRAPGGGDVFVSRIAANGGSLVWSTYVGGRDYETPSAVALASDGSAVAVGWTRSTNYPTTRGAFDTSYNTGGDGFVTRVSKDGRSLVFSTYIGGTQWDDPRDVVVDSSGVTVAGEAWGISAKSDFPTTRGAFQTAYGGGKSDTFVCRLDSAGSRLLWSTFLGGNHWDPVKSLAVSRGRVHVGGATYSSNWRTTSGAYDTSFGGAWGDGFVSVLDGNGSRLLAATFLGDSQFDGVTGVAIDSNGRVVLGGWTASTTFPTTSKAFQKTYGGGKGDGFVARMSADLKTLSDSTLYGGSSFDGPYAAALGPSGSLVVGGETWSSNLPTSSNAFDRGYNSGGDGFVGRVSFGATTQQYRVDISSVEPSSGVVIAANPRDVNGRSGGPTPLALTYAANTDVTLTAPSSSSSGPFKRWLLDGVGQTNGQRILSFKMTANRKAVAEYAAPPKYRLSISSVEPASGVQITVSPNDVNGKGTGPTPLALDYVANTTVTLTAPASSTRGPFKRWVIDLNAQPLGQRIVRVRMSVSRKAVAEYYVHDHGSFTAYGKGCPGTGGKVPLHSGGGHPDIGQAITWRLANARATSPALMFLGATRVSVDLSSAGMAGCFAYVPAITTFVLVTDSSGAAFAPITIPDAKALIGVKVMTQCAIFDIGTKTSVKFVWTNGLETRVGGNR